MATGSVMTSSVYRSMAAESSCGTKQSQRQSTYQNGIRAVFVDVLSTLTPRRSSSVSTALSGRSKRTIHLPMKSKKIMHIWNFLIHILCCLFALKLFIFAIRSWQILFLSSVCRIQCRVVSGRQLYEFSAVSIQLRCWAVSISAKKDF